MAVRDDFASGEVLTATDLNDTFAAKLDTTVTTKGDLLTYGTDVARLGVGTNGQVLTADSGEALGIKWGEAPSGKILQIVRATDSTDRSTSSTSYVDANLSITITPQKSDSVIVLIANPLVAAGGTTSYAELRISDSSNNPISGAEASRLADDAIQCVLTLIGYATPATTSATTYKLRFRVSGGSGSLTNSLNTGQMYAIEVSA